MNFFDEIKLDVAASFGSLWKFKERGNTLEIITPFVATNNSFASVFVSERQGQFVISDGAWIDNSEYGVHFMLSNDCFSKIFFHYQNAYRIKEAKTPYDKIVFYKTVDSKLMISSAVFDLATFISSIVSAASIQFQDKTEIEHKLRFKKHANNFISSFVNEDNLELRGYLDNDRRIKVSAIVKNRTSMKLVNYITGVNAFYFSGSIYKSNWHFELANASQFKSHIKGKVALIDDTASGFVPDKVNNLINHLSENTGSKSVFWSQRERLSKLLKL
jgi:hypothetical protein